jgi:hypothetical protein
MLVAEQMSAMVAATSVRVATWRTEAEITDLDFQRGQRNKIVKKIFT